MSNFGIDAPPAHLLMRHPAAYQPPVQTSHLYGGDFFTPRAIPGPAPMPGSHSP
jgi:hypothetical protein